MARRDAAASNPHKYRDIISHRSVAGLATEYGGCWELGRSGSPFVWLWKRMSERTGHHHEEDDTGLLVLLISSLITIAFTLKCLPTTLLPTRLHTFSMADILIL